MSSAAGADAVRAHLIEDINVAKDLGIRYADARSPHRPTPEGQHLRDSCTARSFEEIARGHGMSVESVKAMGTARAPWIDLLAVFLPVAILFTVASVAMLPRVLGAFDRQDRGERAAMVAVLMPLAAGVGVALAGIWGVMVEQLRLRNEHISYRGLELPASRHGWLLWVIAMVLFAGVGARHLLRAERAPVRRLPGS